MVAERNRRRCLLLFRSQGHSGRQGGGRGWVGYRSGCARLRRRRAYKAAAASQAQQFTSMYKTVRHGENSLQYTILPQQEGGPEAAAAFSSGRKESSGCGRSAVLVAICVVLVGGVVAAVVVPFLVSSQVVVHYHRLRGPPVPSPAPTVALNISAADDYDVTVRLTFETTSQAPSPPPAVAASSAAPTDTSTVVDDVPTSAAPVAAAASVVPEEAATDGASTVSTMRTTTTTTTTVASTSSASTAPTTTAERRHRTTPPPTATSTLKPHGKSWLPSKWPFVDPASTYAQWTVSTNLFVFFVLKRFLLFALDNRIFLCVVTYRYESKADKNKNQFQ